MTWKERLLLFLHGVLIVLGIWALIWLGARR
jgi:hypothetical protein